ncbi:MAG: potassium transporter Kup [Acidobacteria bacterium]|nr:potassium transporter Kup [Acidobacteriota bacterium]
MQAAALTGQTVAPEVGVHPPVKTRSFNEAAHKLEDWPTRQQEEERAPRPSKLPFTSDENRDVVAHAGRAIVALGALGVVFGDIGTSPLYTEQVIFTSNRAAAQATVAGVYGIVSLIFWALMIVVTIKYAGIIMRAHNRGDGGIMALTALVQRRRVPRAALLIVLGIFGASLFFGDGMITPAISVLSAVEGLKVATPLFTPYVVPLTIVVLIGLFAIQKYGTAKVGAAFGPVMLIWFTSIALLGVPHIIREPHVLSAILPTHAVRFFLDNRVTGFLALGSVFLVVTGGEALYADMGHFGARPIRIVWFNFVFPALLLNYFGQGAYLLHSPHGADEPFFRMAPQWALYPLVGLATAAAVIASQAVISGAFSLTRQAVQLGYLPRIRIRHTSAREIGQIYITSINWILMLAAIGLVLAFEKSSNLAAAYGVAVTATMAVTTMLYAAYRREKKGWNYGRVALFVVPLLTIDLAFFGANVVKVLDGGWFPLAVGLLIFTLMSTWRLGRKILADKLAAESISVDAFLAELASAKIPRVKGTAVFMSRNPDGVPTTLLHNIKHNKVVHQRVVLMTIETEDRSHLSDDERFQWLDLGHGVFRLMLHFGFMEDPNLPAVLERIDPSGPIKLSSMATSYFLGRETLIPTRRRGMAIWREHVFAWMMRNSSSASVFFSLPPNQVIELGAQVEL